MSALRSDEPSSTSSSSQSSNDWARTLSMAVSRKRSSSRKITMAETRGSLAMQPPAQPALEAAAVQVAHPEPRQRQPGRSGRRDVRFAAAGDCVAGFPDYLDGLRGDRAMRIRETGHGAANEALELQAAPERLIALASAGQRGQRGVAFPVRADLDERARRDALQFLRGQGAVRGRQRAGIASLELRESPVS